MRLWRLGGPGFPLWSGEGARLYGGRWNQKGTPAIYTASSFALGVLEIIVRANIGRVPKGMQVIAIDIPDNAPVEHAQPREIEGWDAHPADASLRYGDAWLRRNQGLVLMVPSAVTGGLDMNAVINPSHPAVDTVIVGGEAAVPLDARLFPAA